VLDSVEAKSLVTLVKDCFRIRKNHSPTHVDTREAVVRCAAAGVLEIVFATDGKL